MAVAAKPRRARDTGVARRQKTLPVVSGELTLRRTDSHPTVKAVGLAVLIGSTGPVTQNVGA